MDDIAPDDLEEVVDTDEDTDTELDSAEGDDVAEELNTEGDEGDDVTEPSDELDEGDLPEEFDFDMYGDRKVTVKVDGEDLEVTLAELRQGFMRHADYSRKTQAVASDRDAAATYRALEAALKRDFKGTTAALRQHYGIADDADNEEILDPLEREVRELRQWRESQEAERRTQSINAELAALKQNDPDLDTAELLEFAMTNQIGSLDVAYRAYAFDRNQTRQTEQAERDRVAEIARQKRIAAKRTAPPVSGGAKRTSSAVAPGSSSNPSLREIIASAIRGE